MTERVHLVKPVHGGYCLGFGEGVTYFVRHGIPGEVVDIEPTRRRRRMVWADAVDIVEPSASRRPSVWPEAGPGGVGGGELVHVCLEAQRRWKADVVAETLVRLGHRDFAAATDGLTCDACPGEDERGGLGWRSRLELTVTPDGLAGMHRWRDQSVQALEMMPLALGEIIDMGLLRPDSPWRALWTPGERIRAVRGAVRIGQRWYDREQRAMETPPRLSYEAAGLTYDVSGEDFWQAHVEGAGVLVRRVLAACADCEGPVLELYCGSGLFTRLLGERLETTSLLAVEGSPSAARSAGRIVEDIGVGEVLAARIDAAAIKEWCLGCSPALIVTDPPRAGMGTQAAQALAASGARRIVYIACDPASLARDGKVLLEAGYRILQLTCDDLYPHTAHVETVAVFDRSEKVA